MCTIFKINYINYLYGISAFVFYKIKQISKTLYFKPFVLLLVIVFIHINVIAQSTFAAYVKDKTNNEAIIGTVVNVVGTNNGGVSDENGLVVITNIIAGTQTLQFKSLGYIHFSNRITFPVTNLDTPIIFLEPEEQEIEEVVVSSTRSSRTIQDIPTRVEIIGVDELNEKENMKSGDIRMVLSESTGIQTLQTSATSGNLDIRIEGMDGRYTQILKNGFPMYSGFSGGLGLMQTPPLDLKRVEIIKGSSSTLYGGGAIAGLVNLISKTPSKNKELTFILNATSAGGKDINGFYSSLFNKFGVTIYAAYDANAPYNPSSTVFTAIPIFTRYTFNPKLFYYLNSKIDIAIGINTSFENRLGGDINYIRNEHDSLHNYFEHNRTERISTETDVTYRYNDNASLKLKNSISHFNRIINARDYIFDGTQNNSFTELVYSLHNSITEWIFGANLFSDNFSELNLNTTKLRNYTIYTSGCFIQNTWDISKKFIVETGLRTDYISKYGFAVLPRISMLYKLNSNLSSRLGGGLGYKTPTLFTEESEKIIYKNILPISSDSNKLEHSYGANLDVNYKTSVFNERVRISINQLFFYTQLTTPLVLTKIGADNFVFKNIDEHIDAQGTETNIKISYNSFKLFLGYTYTHSHIHNLNYYYETPLTPRHHTNSVLMYEKEGKLKLGIEAYYYSPQHLSDGTIGKDYWLCGFMAEKIRKKYSIFINFENILDSRQTRFDTIYTGTIQNPEFRDIYAPLDGFVVNGGIKLKL